VARWVGVWLHRGLMGQRTAAARSARRRLAVLPSWVVLLAVIVAVYLGRLDRVCGLFADDAWYVLLAKALATGHGYTLINAPTPGIVPVYPPGFPVLLSLVFRIAPRFPENVPLLKAVSILAMAGVALLTMQHCRRDQGLTSFTAWAIALATAVHPAFVFLATSTVMSECVFTLVQLASVVVVERAVRSARGTAATWNAFLGGVLASVAFLTRTMAIAAVVAGLLRLVFGRRDRAPWLAFGFAVALVAGPWLLYARVHVPTVAAQMEENDAVVYGYGTHFWLRVAGHAEYGSVTGHELPQRVAGAAAAVARSSMGALHVYFPFRSVEPASWGIAPGWAHAVAMMATALAVLGFGATVRTRITIAELLVPLSLLITLAWPFPPTRYVLPLLPFVLCYTARGLGVLARLASGRERPAFAPVVLCALAGVSLLTNAADAASLHRIAAEPPRWNLIFEERIALFRWLVGHVPSGQVIATFDPAQLTLYTGFTTVGYWRPTGAVDEWRGLGVRFFADTSYVGGSPTLARFQPVYRAGAFGLQVLDLGPIYDRR
jgi:hypothetical protein